MKVAVLGAGGTIAPAIVRDLAESEEAEALLLLDVDEARAARVAAEQGGGKATAHAADARAGLADHLAEVDVLVNAAAYRINLEAMEACLEAGCHYVDLGGLFHVTGRQLELSDRFERAGLLALLGIGSAPGKTNLMASVAVRELAERPEWVWVFAAGRDLDPPTGLSVPYSLQTLVDELSVPPVVLTRGSLGELEPLARGPRMDFGEPIGAGETIYTLHSEIRTFPESFGCESAAFWLSLAPELLEGLRELAGANEERVAEVARSVSPPSPRTVAVHLVEAGDPERIVTVRSLTPPHERWGLGGGIVSTASPAAAAVRLLARGLITARGALPPERCIDPEAMLPELESRGVVLETQTAPRDEDREPPIAATMASEASQ
jgi:lysine 6-dehydrogenase